MNQNDSAVEQTDHVSFPEFTNRLNSMRPTTFELRTMEGRVKNNGGGWSVEDKKLFRQVIQNPEIHRSLGPLDGHVFS